MSEVRDGLTADDPLSFENSQMFGYGHLRKPEFFHELGDALGRPFERLDDAEAFRMSDDAQHARRVP